MTRPVDVLVVSPRRLLLRTPTAQLWARRYLRGPGARIDRARWQEECDSVIVDEGLMGMLVYVMSESVFGLRVEVAS